MRCYVMNKKIIAVTFATGIMVQATCSIIPDSEISNAAIIQPKLCYSDIWVTDYEVIGTGRLESISGKYPYLEHRLDVYTDGTAKYYEYNNYEWDSYSYDPDCTVIFDGYGTDWTLTYDYPPELAEGCGQTVPTELLDFYERKYDEFNGIYYFGLKQPIDYKEYCNAFDTVSDEELSNMFSFNVVDVDKHVRSRKYTFSQPKLYNLSGLDVTYDTINEFYESYKNIGGSLYPYIDYSNDYTKRNKIISDIKFNKSTKIHTLRRDCKILETIDNDVYDRYGGIEILSISRTECRGTWVGKLANLPYINDATHTDGWYANVQYIEITPTTDFTNGMSFQIGDHKTEVPASAFTSDEPIINQTSLEDRVIELEKENQKLRSELGNNNVKLDNHKSGYVTASDAQDVLMYYCESIVGNESGKVEDYNSFIAGDD